jgi:hypothetical protein
METPGITAAPSARTSNPLAPKISPLLPESVMLSCLLIRRDPYRHVHCPPCTLFPWKRRAGVEATT